MHAETDSTERTEQAMEVFSEVTSRLAAIAELRF
jgi:hypothetical protein